MSTDDKLMMGRIAFRQEGTLWNAYYALPDTMEGALFLGSIRMFAVEGPRKKKQKKIFMKLMQDMVHEILQEKGAVVADWLVNAAPEHERGGNA